jgi:hypothetical protein
MGLWFFWGCRKFFSFHVPGMVLAFFVPLAGYALSPMVQFQDLVAGSGEAGFEEGPFYSARFNAPAGLAVNTDGSVLYLADQQNNRIRAIKLDDKNTVETLAGTGEAGAKDGPVSLATFNQPTALAYLPDDTLVVLDRGNLLLRLVDLKANTVSTLAGGGQAGLADGNPLKAAFTNLWDITYFPPDQSLYFSEPSNGVLWKLDLKTKTLEKALQGSSQVPRPAAVGWCDGKVYLADLALPGVYQLLASPAKSGPTPSQTPGPAPATGGISQVGIAQNVLALAGSGKALYAYQADPKAPILRVFPDSGPLTFKSVWGDLLINPDPGSILQHFKNVVVGDRPGLAADPRSAGRFFVTNPGRSIICSFRDLRLAELDQVGGETIYNSAKIHDFEYPSAKPKGTYRILLVGRSYIFWTDDGHKFEKKGLEGESEQFMHTLAKRLELSLNTMAALEDVPLHYEVLNGGMHHGSTNEINLFAYYITPPLIKQYDVDLVLIMQDEGFGIESYFRAPLNAEGIPGDELDGEFYLKPNKEKFRSGFVRDFFDLCLKKKLMVATSEKIWSFTDIEALVSDPDLHKPLIEMMGKPLFLLKKKMDTMKNGSGQLPQLALCYFPVNPFTPPKKRLFWKDLCQTGQFLYLDLCDDFIALGYSYYPYQGGESGHFTTDGMFLFSTILMDELLRHHMIPFGAPKESN